MEGSDRKMNIIDWIKDQNTVETFIRLCLAMISGLIIGIDRGVKRRGAGVKTYSLVCLGAAIVMLTGEFVYRNYGSSMDISRLGAQVISGVGFLGVGTIIVTGRNQVRGLTTAAGLWTCACIGLAFGIGFYDGAAIMLFLCIIVLKIFSRIDAFIYCHSKVLDLYIGFHSMKQIPVFLDELKQMDIKIQYFEVGKSKIIGDESAALLTIEIPRKLYREEVLNWIKQMEEIVFVDEL